MSYSLGLDLGTTSSAAAVNDGSSVRMLTVDHSAAVIPSVVHLDADGTILVGPAAVRKAISDPSGVAREFKRRFGDPQPLILSGTPVSANDLTLEVATALVGIATQQLGAPPERLVVCHPANWGSYKSGLLSDTLSNSRLPEHVLITEPEAAAIHYASQERVGDGEVIAVYDLGGGTFDAAVLRKTADQASGWELLGEPRGIERLGGIDFDIAVLNHVIGVLDLDLDSFDSDDATHQAAMTRFRAECREAKHALSSDVSATVPVLLPGHNDTVRITRREFEQLIDPAVGRTIDTLEVAVSTTGLEMDAIDRILLVGGSTRVPLVAARLAEATNRPIKSDAHPKHAIALGAAAFAGVSAQPAGSPPAPTPPEPAASESAQPEPAPPSAPAPSTLTPPPPATPSKPAPSHTELYRLPHIDEEPLPDFMKGRGAPPPSVAAAPTAAGPTAAASSVPAPTPAAPAPLGPPPTTGPATRPESVGPVIIDEATSGPRSPVAVFALSFVAVAALLGIVLFGFVGLGDDDGETAATTSLPDDEPTASTTVPSTEPAPVVSVDPNSNCEPNQFPVPGVRYRVTEIPDTFPEPTLNGRNVPSTSAVNGVESRPITTFLEFSELDLDYSRCHVAENGRVWFAVDYSGPDDAGGTFSGIVWASTRFIEAVPE